MPRLSAVRILYACVFGICGMLGMFTAGATAAAPVSEREVASETVDFRCPAQRYRPKGPRAEITEDDAQQMLAAALMITGEVKAAHLETPGVAGYGGIITGVVGEGQERTAAILPLLWCERAPCVGAGLRFPGAQRVRLHALIDLAGFGGDVEIAEGEGPTAPYVSSGCMRRPALIVEIVDGSERGEDSLLMILSLETSKPEVIQRERSHRGAEGGSRVETLRFRSTRGGSASDLVVLRRRESGADGGRGAERSQHLFNFVDGRYQYAP